MRKRDKEKKKEVMSCSSSNFVMSKIKEKENKKIKIKKGKKMMGTARYKCTTCTINVHVMCNMCGSRAEHGSDTHML